MLKTGPYYGTVTVKGKAGTGEALSSALSLLRKSTSIERFQKPLMVDRDLPPLLDYLSVSFYEEPLGEDAGSVLTFSFDEELVAPGRVAPDLSRTPRSIPRKICRISSIVSGV
jgi:hypothetical protein